MEGTIPRHSPVALSVWTTWRATENMEVLPGEEEEEAEFNASEEVFCCRRVLTRSKGYKTESIS